MFGEFMQMALINKNNFFGEIKKNSTFAHSILRTMIQRIQTVYLLLVAVVGILTFFLDVEWLKLLLFAASAILAIYTILKYKKRRFQLLLNWLNILINVTLLGVFVYRMLNSSGELVSEKGVGLFVPVLSIVFLFLANKAILRDERLVKSADRLR